MRIHVRDLVQPNSCATDRVFDRQRGTLAIRRRGRLVISIGGVRPAAYFANGCVTCQFEAFLTFQQQKTCALAQV
ncbi:hypothetical protein D3C87_1934970 [compost metagenome]